MSESVQTHSEYRSAPERRERLFYLDAVRAFAAVLIVITHFNNPFLVDRPVFANSPFGIYIGSLGVSLFLIISGAALMYTQGDREKLNLVSFYRKRAKTIYPMFWIAFVVANLFHFWRSGWLFGDTPKWRILLSLFAVDGYVANMHVATFYTLGEWFLGFILIFYALFPLLRKGVKEYPVLTAGIIAILYVGTMLSGRTLFQLPQDLLFTVRLPEIAFGMYFVRYIKKVPNVVGAGAVVLLALQQWREFLTGNLAVTIVGIAFFLAMVWVCQYIGTPHAVLRMPTNWLSKYSYAIFLTHHVIIVDIFSYFARYHEWSQLQIYGLFLVDCILIGIASWVLFYVERYTVRTFSALGKKIRRR
ncbi:acyltransferase family protein [Alloscardovia macacae]|uniref:Acyltransferase n=1 Tax=Alloscardovia macacae TaxID=1160091 RepID=A0A261F6Y7_9BIFI|nr:acyltransferase [Alloscardovia macacae]OZG54901.1 acyltransferase [Alloscardovia macacae]